MTQNIVIQFGSGSVEHITHNFLVLTFQVLNICLKIKVSQIVLLHLVLITVYDNVKYKKKTG